MKRWLQATLGLMLVSGFGSCALVLAGPVTPIQFDVGPVASLLNPQFSQNWQLFAPDPISDERGVVARLRCGRETTNWIDISSRAIEETQRSRFFPSRESRIVSNALIERLAQDDITERLELRDAKELLPEDDAARRRAERVLARYAARVASCPRATSQTPTAAQLRFVTRSLPPWSKRLDPSAAGRPRLLESDWIDL